MQLARPAKKEVSEFFEISIEQNWILPNELEGGHEGTWIHSQPKGRGRSLLTDREEKTKIRSPVFQRDEIGRAEFRFMIMAFDEAEEGERSCTRPSKRGTRRTGNTEHGQRAQSRSRADLTPLSRTKRRQKVSGKDGLLDKNQDENHGRTMHGKKRQRAGRYSSAFRGGEGRAPKGGCGTKGNTFCCRIPENGPFPKEEHRQTGHLQTMQMTIQQRPS